MAGNWSTCFGVRVPRTLDYPVINLNHMITMLAHPRQTNVMAIARQFVVKHSSTLKTGNFKVTQFTKSGYKK